MTTRRHLPLSLLLISAFSLQPSAFSAALPQKRDSVNNITRRLVLDAVATNNNRHLTAAQAFDNGAFRGFQPAPGHENSFDDIDTTGTPLIDFLTLSTVVDADGNPDYNYHPLDDLPPGYSLRNLQPGDKTSYASRTHYKASEPNTLPSGRYGIPFIMGGDRAGNYYPILIGATDYPPDGKTPVYDVFDPRDTLTMLGLFPEFMGTMGNSHPMTGNHVFTRSVGFADTSVHGMVRSAFPLMPNPVPKPGSLWYSCGMQKTFTPRIEASPDEAEHKKNTLVTKFVIGKRMDFVFGARDPATHTKPLDTLVVALGFNYANNHGTAPDINNASTQLERLYLTKEFGYVTRWETWSCVENTGKEVIEVAKQWYRENNLNKPADFQGIYTEHFEIKPLIEDTEEGYYYYDQHIKNPDNPDAPAEVRRWYYIGGWDFTNITKRDTPVDLFAAFADPAKFGPYFLRPMGVGVDTTWTGTASGNLADPDNWQHPQNLPADTPVPFSHNLNIPTATRPAHLANNHNTLAAYHSMDLAYNNGDRANLTLSNATLNLPYYLLLSENADTRAVLTLADNSTINTGNLYAASKAASTADITLTRSAINVTERSMLARNGTLALNIRNSTLHIGNLIQIAYNPAANANITLAGNSTLSAGNTIQIGNGTLTLNIRPDTALPVTPYITAPQLETLRATPININLDCANLPLAADTTLAFDIIRTTTPVNTDITPVLINNNPETHQIKIRWNATKTLLQAIISASPVLIDGNLILDNNENRAIPQNLLVGNQPGATALISVTRNSTLTLGTPSTETQLAVADNSTIEIHLADNSSLNTQAPLFIACGNAANAGIRITDNSSLNTQNTLEIATAGNTTANLEITNNSAIGTWDLWLGNTTATLAGNSRLSAGNATFIANNSTNTVILHIENSTLITPRLYTAAQPGSNATLNLRRAIISNTTNPKYGTNPNTLDYTLANNGTLSLDATDSTLHATNLNIANATAANATLSLANSTLSTFQTMDLAKNGRITATLRDKAIIDGRYDLNISENGTASITLDNATLNATRNITFAKNGNITATLSNNSRLAARDNITFAQTGTANITLESSKILTSCASNTNLIPNLTFATDGILTLTLSTNSTITANIITLAANTAGTADIALLGNSTLTAKTLVIGQGKTNISLRPRQAAAIPISVTTLINHSIPVLSIDCSEFPLPSANQSTLTLIQSTNPSATPAFDLRPTNIPKNHDISIDWSADKKSLTATLRRITPDLATQDDHLLYALTDNYTLTNDNRPTANGSLSHLPRLRIRDNILSFSYTPKRTSYTYEVQQSADLQNWITLQTLTPNATQTLEEQIYQTPASADRLFLRLKITPASE